MSSVVPGTAALSQPLASGAVLSDCGRYRYRLWRSWELEARRLWFVMLNPSTADAETDDPTIRKCVGFAQRWGFGGVEVVNLFAYRATNPSSLDRVADPKGPENDAHLARGFTEGRAHDDAFVAAWGAKRQARRRALTVKASAKAAGVTLLCLAKNDDGSPKHPLYVPYTALAAPLGE